MIQYTRAWDDMIKSTAYSRIYKKQVESIIALDTRGTVSYPKLFTALYTGYMNNCPVIAKLTYNRAVMTSRIECLKEILFIAEVISDTIANKAAAK